MAIATLEIIEGNTLRFDVYTSAQLRADWQVGGVTQTETVDAVSGEIAFAPSAAGTYYLATRTDATTDWCRYGILEVVALVDLTYEQMKTELANVNSRIATAQDSLIQYQVTDPSGTAVTRMTLSALMRTRGNLEARLANYERAARGDPPVRFS